VTLEPERHLEALTRHAHRYELGALVRALLSLSFDWHSIEFEGQDELEGNRRSLVHSLRLERAPVRRAVVTLNSGLLAPGSPLPEYFRSFIRNEPSPEGLVCFLRFFDAVQLKDLAYCAEPSLGAGRASRIERAHRSRLNPNAPMVLHQLFREMFPELPVALEPRVFTRERGAGRARLGSTMDGQSFLGGHLSERFPGYRVVLHVSDEAAQDVPQWEPEALRRIERMHRWLARMSKAVELVLFFDRYRYGQELVPDAGHRQLGVRPWLTKQKGQVHGPGAVIVWRSWEELGYSPIAVEPS
jgi:hypothetical protein